MKELVLMIIGACYACMLHAQLSKTVNVETAGTLSSLLATEELSSVTNFTVMGTIDSVDLVAIKSMSKLSVLDLSSVAVTGNVIPRKAFSDCSSLTSITIPLSVTSIGDSSFCNCTGLKLVSIPAVVTSIGSYAFYGCGLTSVTIPGSVTFIGKYAFYGCEDLTSIALPSSIDTINDFVFYDCRGLTSVSIPASVTSIGRYAFQGCSGLTSLELPESLTHIGDGAFSGCRGVTSVVIPSSIDTVNSFVFSRCSSLTSITIFESLSCVGFMAFSGCPGLSSIYAYPGNPATIVNTYRYAYDQYLTMNSCFDSSVMITCVVYVPYASKRTYQKASGWADFLNIKEMMVSTRTVTVGNDSASIDIAVTSDTAWVATADRSWINLIVSSGNGYNYLKFIAVPNITDEERAGNITITSDGEQQVVSVIQQPGKIATKATEHDLASISIYPNPTSGKVTIETTGFSYVEIYSLLGSTLLGKRVSNTGYLTIDIPVGVYVVTASNAKSVCSETLVVK